MARTSSAFLSSTPAHVAAGAVAGAIAAVGFAPVESVIPTLIGMAALMVLVLRGDRPFAAGFGFGVGHFAVGLAWIATAFTFQSAMPPVMGWVAVVGLSFYLALFPALAAKAAHMASAGRGLAFVLLFAALFTLAEIARGLLFTGFPWNPLGAPWLGVPGVAGLGAFIGASGLSATMILAAGSIVALFTPEMAGRWWLVAVLPVLLGAGVLLTRSPSPAARTGPRLLLVQPDTDQADKTAPGGADRAIARLLGLTRAGLSQHSGIAAVIWPEAAVDYPLNEDPDLARLVSAPLGRGMVLLTGGIALERDAGGRVLGARNSLYALDADGRTLLRYDKAHLVPGGEYLPLRAIAEPLGLSRVVPGSLDFLPGPGPTSYRLPFLGAFGPAICYEIIFAGAIVDRDDRPAWILTVSNDAWFGPSGPPQHFAQARLRAIEEGVPVVRVTTTGISGVIGPGGEVVARLRPHVPEAMAVRLPPPRAPTVVARLGLLAPALLALLLALGGMAVRRKT